ncbi:MAG TPA: M56 family metallopeptidase [Acidobacteriaceae bacterium]|jgi:hypothetical protein|nr:M56 family metallopeptidase [Acidobacteriaceae bacterium]
MTAMMIEAALRGLVLAVLVGAGLRVLRVTNVPVRKAVWTLVLVASTAMPFLMRWSAVTGLAERFAWVVPIHRIATEGAVLRPMATAKAETETRTETVANAAPAVVIPATDAMSNDTAEPATQVEDAAPVVSVTAAVPTRTWHWPPAEQLIPMIYLAVSGALLLRLLWGVGAAWWLWARAEEVSPLVAPEPSVRVSEKVPSPVTIGSGILLPANYAEWGHAKLRVVLAHERSHVRQMDFYLQMLAGLYTAFFWFSPLGWWLKRTLSALGEAISDRAGMQVAPSRSDYAGVLLDFAAATQRSLPGVAMARRGNLSRRVEQLLNESLFRRAFAEGRRRAVVSLLLIPAALFTVTALVRVPTAAAQSAPPPPPVTASAPVATMPDAQTPDTPEAAPLPAPSPDQQPNQAADQRAGDEPAPAAAPAPAQQPAPAPKPSPAVPKSDDEMPMVLDVGPSPDTWVKIPKMPAMKIVVPKIPNIHAMVLSDLDHQMTLGGLNGGIYAGMYAGAYGGANGYAYHFSSNGDSWAVVDGPGDTIAFSGNGSAKELLDQAQQKEKGPFLWFTHEGKSYIVNDAATVARIRALYDPMKSLGEQQRALGVQQRVLGRMESELARSERTDASVRVPDLSKEMADAEAALNSLKSEQGQMLSEEKLAEMQQKLAEVEAKLGSLEASRAMQNNFGERMRALGEQQRQLGDQQRQLGDQQRKMAEQAEHQVQSILQQCLQNGTAKLVK